MSYFAGTENPFQANKEYLKSDSTFAMKNSFIFENITKHFGSNLSKDTQKELINDLAKLIQVNNIFLSAITKISSVFQPIFELSDYYSDTVLLEIHSILLIQIMNTQPENVWEYVRGCPNYQLSLLNRLLEFCIISFVPIDEKTGPQRIMQYIKFLNTTEDLILKDPSILRTEELKQVISRLLILLNKAGIMYISLPTLALFDERAIITQEREQTMKLHWNAIKDSGTIMREGGILRILLKLIFFLIKFDSTPSTVSCSFLNYLLIKDKDSKKLIKQISKISSEKKKIKCHRVKYNAIDIFINRKDQEKIKAYNASNEFFLKKVIWNENSLLDNCKINKAIQQFPKEKSIFEQNSYLIMFAISQLLQLAQYELLGIDNYVELQKIDITQILGQYLTGHAKITSKYSNIVNLIKEILKDEIWPFLKNDMDILLVGFKGKYERHYLKSNELNLETVYTFLDTVIENKQTHEIAFIQHLDAKEDEKVDEAAISKQNEELEKFRSSWKGFIDSLHESIKKSDAHLCLINLLLNKKQICLTQPYLHFVTTHNLKTIDILLANKLIFLKKQSVTSTTNGQEIIKFFKDFEDRIRDRFGYLSVHLDKMGKIISFII